MPESKPSYHVPTAPESENKRRFKAIAKSCLMGGLVFACLIASLVGFFLMAVG